MSQQTNKIVLTILAVVINLLIVISLGLSSYGLYQIAENRDNITALKASQFTAQDGLDVWKAIGDIRERLAADGAGSSALFDRLNRMEADMQRRFDELKSEIRAQPYRSTLTP